MAGSASSSPITLRLGHSPDPDDAFMWWPLFELDGQPPPIASARFRFVPVAEDIEALNQRAANPDDPLEITAMSCAQFPFVRARYAITACGASMGDGYGPKLVAREGISWADLTGGRDDLVVAVPGVRTSAFATLTMMLGRGTFRYEVLPFDEVIPAVSAGMFAAGLVIHEGQLTYADSGLRLLADLGAWWSSVHRLPLPLGVNAVRRDLDELHGGGTLGEVTRLLRRSVEHALANREASIAYALRYARGISTQLADRFIAMYVNQWTLDFGARGREAVRTFLVEMERAGLTHGARESDLQFVGG